MVEAYCLLFDWFVADRDQWSARSTLTAMTANEHPGGFQTTWRFCCSDCLHPLPLAGLWRLRTRFDRRGQAARQTNRFAFRIGSRNLDLSRSGYRCFVAVVRYFVVTCPKLRLINTTLLASPMTIPQVSIKHFMLLTDSFGQPSWICVPHFEWDNSQGSKSVRTRDRYTFCLDSHSHRFYIAAKRWVRKS